MDPSRPNPMYGSDVLQLQIGDWTLDLGSDQLTRGEERHRLGPLEKAVLLHLTEVAPNLVPSDALLAQHWHGLMVGDNVLHRVIARLRKVLGDDARNPVYIETLSKRGYRLLASVSTAESGGPRIAQQPQTRKPSIAVLPFDNLSPDPDNAHFAAGIHAEVLDQLAKIEGLSVIARTTMLRYAGGGKSIPEIRSELNVDTMMEGSVRYTGKRVRIALQLIDAVSGTQLWSKTHEDDLEDIFRVQLAIALDVVSSLQAEISIGARRSIGRRATQSAEAYSHYLQALSKWGNLAATAPVHRALDAAILLDPEFAAPIAMKAWIRGAEAGYFKVFGAESFGAKDQEDLIRESERLAKRALALSTYEPRAELALGTVDIHDRNWAAARESNVSAYLAQTSDYIALATRGCSAWRSEGDVSAAIRYFEHSIELNPADAGNIWFSGVVMYWAQQWKAAQNQALTVVEMLPGVAFGYALHALASSRLGDREAVYRHARQGESCAPGLTDLAMIARAYAQIGDHQESRRIFKSACAGVDAKNQDPEWQFWMHMSVEDYDRALSYLTRAIETNFPFNFVADVHFESAHPDFDPIRSYPEFDELVQRTALPLRNGAS